MSHSRRQSLSSSWIESHGSWMDSVRLGSQSPAIQISSPGPGASNPSLGGSGLLNPAKDDVDAWVKEWECVLAKDLIDSRIVSVDAEATVDEACEILLKEDIPCLVVTSTPASSAATDDTKNISYDGLFDFSDVNAFLTLAATRHNIPTQRHHPTNNPASDDDSSKAAVASIVERANEIIEAAKAGTVNVGLVSNFSQKNPLESLPSEATIIDLLRLFSRGVHRALIASASASESASAIEPESTSYAGLVSDRALLSWFSSYAARTPSFLTYLNNTLHALHISSCSSPTLTSTSLDPAAQLAGSGAVPVLLPSLYIYTDVVAAGADQPVLDAMRLMSEEGVSSVAVLEGGHGGVGEGGSLVSAVSVTDVGKIVVPSESKQILYLPLQQFITLIKAPLGSTDGEETYPVYSLSPSSRLSYAIDKLLATTAHRLFITEESRPPSNSASPIISPIALGGHHHGHGHSSSFGAGLGRGVGNRLSGILSIVDILTVFAHLASLPAHEIDPTRQKRRRRMSSNSTHSPTTSSPSQSLSSSFTEQEFLRSAHSVSPVLGALGLAVGAGVGAAVGTPMGRSTSRSSLSSRSAASAGGSQRISGSFVLPGPIVAGQGVPGLGDLGAGRARNKNSSAGVDEGVGKVNIGSAEGEIVTETANG